MFLLTSNYDEDRTVFGVFTTVDKAKKYVEKVLNREDVQWSDPTHNINGDIWANSGGGHLRIDAVELNPKKR